MKIIVNPHDLTIEEKSIVNEGEYNITQLNFEFSKEYTDDLVKKAIFIGDDNKAYEMLILNNACMIPSEILLKNQLVLLGVYAYKVDGDDLVLRYSPTPKIFQISDGSYKADSIPSEEITPSQFDQYQQALQNGLAEVNAKLQEVINTSETLEENGTYAKEQGDYAKETTDELVSKVENGDFNGATFTPSVSNDGDLSWSNDKGLDNPITVNIKGQKGDTGEPFTISKTYPSVEAMEADFDNMEVGDYVMIASSVDDEDNAKLYVKTDTEWVFITDFSGAIGIQGEPGVGISNITSGDYTESGDYTVTPVTFYKTDGSNVTLNISVKNGAKGDTGDKGDTGVGISEVASGTTREEAGYTVTPLTFTKTDESANTVEVKVKNGVDGTDGANGEDGADGVGITTITAGTPSITEEKTITPITFNKTDGSNQTVNVEAQNGETQDLSGYATNDSLDNIVPKNDASGEDITIDDALEHKLFNFEADGSSEQVTTTGKNLLPYPYVETEKTENGITYTVNDNGSVLLNGTATSDTSLTLFGSIAGSSIDDIPGDYVTGGTSDVHVRVVSRLNSEYHLIADNTSGFTKIDKSVYTKGYVEIKITAGKTFNNVTIYPMLSNEANIDWEPYTGGQPSPSPDYPQPITTLTFNKITRCGKNLYNVTDIDTYYINVVGEDVSVDEEGWITIDVDNSQSSSEKFNNYWTKFSNSLKPNTKYNIFLEIKEVSGTSGYISVVSETYNSQFNNSFLLNLKDISGNSIKNKICITKQNHMEENMTMLRTFLSTPANSKNKITFRISVIEDVTVTPQNFVYEPYQATEYAIDLQGNEMVELPNGVKDELVIDKQGNVSLIKNVGKYFFDGSENWVSLPTTDTYWEFSITYETGQHANYTYSLSNYFSDKDYNSLICTKLEVYIRFPKNIGIDVSDVEKFKSWLQSHNTIAYYELTEPQTIQLGKLSDIITTLHGTNNISINGNIPTNISATYALDIKKYVDNKIAQLSEQLIKGE